MSRVLNTKTTVFTKPLYLDDIIIVRMMCIGEVNMKCNVKI